MTAVQPCHAGLFLEETTLPAGPILVRIGFCDQPPQS